MSSDVKLTGENILPLFSALRLLPSRDCLFRAIVRLQPCTVVRRQRIKRHDDARPRAKRAAWDTNDLRSAQDNTFVLYRIIGNDLAPRQRLGQSLENLRFILEHEPELEGCEKRFIVNRILNPQQEQAVVDTLQGSGFQFSHIPFCWEEYKEADWDIAGVPVSFATYSRKFRGLSEGEQGRVMMRLYRHKNNAVINNNATRNRAIAEGSKIARWVLPWDGNCFLTQDAWMEIRDQIQSQAHFRYFMVPMARGTDNRRLLEAGFRPDAVDEPQMVFRADAEERFDEGFFYGRRPKVELFWRLGVPGPWDNWELEPWDLPVPDYSKDTGTVGEAGWVARLDSGQPALERSSELRFGARVAAVTHTLDRLDRLSYTRAGRPSPYRVSEPFVQTIPVEGMQAFNACLRDRVEKSVERIRHGKRFTRQITSMRQRGSNLRYANDVRVLTLGGLLLHDERLVQAAAEDLDKRARKDKQGGPLTGVTNRSFASLSDGASLWYFLDAVRTLEGIGALTARADRWVRWTLKRRLRWLEDTRSGQRARASHGVEGTYYDLQVLAGAAFLDWDDRMRATLRDSRFRLLAQFAQGARTNTARLARHNPHAYCFNLQGWVYLARLAADCGEDLWGFRDADGGVLCRAVTGLLGRREDWRQKFTWFDQERLYPILAAAQDQSPGESLAGAAEAFNPWTLQAVFPEGAGIPPFWQIPKALGLVSVQHVA